MKPTKMLQEIRKMRLEEAYEGWNAGRLTQAEAARILGVCERSFCRYMWRYEECKLKVQACTAIACELAGFIWTIGQALPQPTAGK